MTKQYISAHVEENARCGAFMRKLMHAERYTNMRVSKIFYDFLYVHLREQLERFAARTVSPTDISFEDNREGKPLLTDGSAGRKKKSGFAENDEVIFFLKLGFPLEFSCCRTDDFRDAYLNAQTDIKVEVTGKGPMIVPPYSQLNFGDDWPSFRTSVYEYTHLNRCVPLVRTTVGKIKEEIRSGFVFREEKEEKCYDSICYSHYPGEWRRFESLRLRLKDAVSDHYFDYLVYCVRSYYERTRNGMPADGRLNAGERALLEKAMSDLAQVPLRLPATDSFLKDGILVIPRRLKRVYRKIDTYRDGIGFFENDSLNFGTGSFDWNEQVLSPYFMTTWRPDRGFEDRWMFFDGFIKEAQRIINGPHPCPYCFHKYPELRKMLDLEDLYIYNVWRNYSHIDLSFLEKDWFRSTVVKRGGYSKTLDELCSRFQGVRYRLISRDDANINHIMGFISGEHDDDWYSEEYLAVTECLPKTCWGYIPRLETEQIEKSERLPTWRKTEWLRHVAYKRLNSTFKKWERRAYRRLPGVEPSRYVFDDLGIYCMFWNVFPENIYNRGRLIRFTDSKKGFEYFQELGIVPDGNERICSGSAAAPKVRTN